MVAMAARSFVLPRAGHGPRPHLCPARFVVDACFEGNWDDAQAAAAISLAAPTYVTLEIEQVSLASSKLAAKFAPVRPSAALLRIIQDRILQKEWLAQTGFPLGPARAAHPNGH